jgi:hypothetical protein
MTDVSALTAMQCACRQAISLYLVACDRKDINQLLQAFERDAVWIRPGMGPMRGHAEIRAFFEAIFKKHAAISSHGHLTRHCLTTVSITALEPKRASGVSYALVYRDATFNGILPTAMPEPELVVEYRDIFVEAEEGWRILQHEARHIFRSKLWGQQLSTDELATLNLDEEKPI